MSVSPAMQAYWDQERRMITEHIRRYGVHLSYVAAGDDPDGSYDCCASLGEAAPDASESDGIAEAVHQMGGDPSVLPPRLSVPFCYTTGLFGFGHPELVVLGLPRQAAGGLLNAVAHRVITHVQDLTPGEVVDIDGITVLVETVPNPGHILFESHDYYQRSPWDPVSAVQLTWADAQGRFPWDAGHLAGPWPQERPGDYRA